MNSAVDSMHFNIMVTHAEGSLTRVALAKSNMTTGSKMNEIKDGVEAK